MKIFPAIPDANLIPMFFEKTGIKLNFLISYHYLRGQACNLDKSRKMRGLLYLDSGAYSVATGKSHITVDEYLRYLNLNGKAFDETFNLDDDFNDPEHNWQNQVYLEKHLSRDIKRPIPVLHDSRDPFAEFETYYDEYDYIAVGSNKKAGDGFFKKMKAKYPDVKIHMFGNLDRKMLLEHRPYSADSASFAHATTFGEMYYWHPEKKKEYRLYLGGREKKGDNGIHFNEFEHKKEVEKFLNNVFGYRYQDLLVLPGAGWIVNFYFMKQLEDHINSLP